MSNNPEEVKKKHPGGRPRFKATKEQVLQAIARSYHNKTTIAARLGCDWNTASRLIDRWTETKKAFEAERQTMNDIAESKAFQLIMDKDGPMIKWWLSKMAKDRGFGDETAQEAQLTAEAGAPALQIEFIDTLDDEEGPAANEPAEIEK